MKWKFWGKDRDKENPLGHIEPRTLASAMVALVFDGENAIHQWRDKGDAIPESHEEFVQISVHVYQLCIFLDLLERRFGSDVAEIVKSHIIALMTTGKVAIDRFFRAVWAGRVKPEREQFFAHDTACQVDCNVSRAFLDVVSGPVNCYWRKVPPSRRVASSLFAVFTWAIGKNLVRGKFDIDCGCMGLWGRRKIGYTLVLRNLSLIGLTAFSVLANGQGWSLANEIIMCILTGMLLIPAFT